MYIYRARLKLTRPRETRVPGLLPAGVEKKKCKKKKVGVQPCITMTSLGWKCRYANLLQFNCPQLVYKSLWVNVMSKAAYNHADN